MADILIRGMEMPKSCYECVLTHSFFRDLNCANLDGMSGFVGPLPHTEDRHPDCPLLPLPEGHGRLIDADALMKKGMHLDWSVQKWVQEFDIMTAPTIVPAEGGTDECSEN